VDARSAAIALGFVCLGAGSTAAGESEPGGENPTPLPRGGVTVQVTYPFAFAPE
jgi:hypothetical protein